MDKTFAFKLDQTVTIAASGETGVIIGRSEYTTAENNYYIRYRAADGRATEQWWQESALKAA